MPAISYRIAEAVFTQFPGYIRGVVVASDVTNDASPGDLVKLLRAAEATVRQHLPLDNLAEHPRIKAWREAYRSFGAKPSEFRSSIEAMVRRVLRHQELPVINTLVDIGNVLSLRYLVPAGGHALDVISHDLSLRPATGKEQFVPLDTEVVEHPLPSEIIFVEEPDLVLTRRWTWRQGKHTLIVPQTRAMELNIDGLPPVSMAEIEMICQEAGELIHRFCGGEIRYELLTQEHPQMRLTG